MISSSGITARPNVVLIVVDDMGWFDLGCLGGEIATPRLDALAARGTTLTQFYNTARCNQSRASLRTGLDPHQTSIGELVADDRPTGYPGSLNERCSTIADTLRDAGYATIMAGKRHLSSNRQHPDASWPTRRGVANFSDTIAGATRHRRVACFARRQNRPSTVLGANRKRCRSRPGLEPRLRTRGEWKLYDLSSDRGQSVDLAASTRIESLR